jgi:prepilin-type N-terminal cleavage/methylation domain-containing protein
LTTAEISKAARNLKLKEFPMSRPRGFTLVEMLVVLGIIAVLIALLAPAVMSAMNSARRSAIATDIGGLHDAVSAYQLKRGDFPPNFRDHDAFVRHVRKCYPKITPAHLTLVERCVWSTPPDYLATNIDYTRVPNMDEGESLVFWLYLVDNDPREPFKAIIDGFGPSPLARSNPLLSAGSPEKLYPFEEDRLVTSDDDLMPSYRASYSKETFYLYIDSRSYELLTTLPALRAYAELPTLGTARPYWSEIRATTVNPIPPRTATAPWKPHYKPMNPTTFQIIGAGQDGLFGDDPPGPPPTLYPGAKFFPGGGWTEGGRGYVPDDNDNMTNFSEGRRLEDHIP